MMRNILIFFLLVAVCQCCTAKKWSLTTKYSLGLYEQNGENNTSENEEEINENPEYSFAIKNVLMQNLGILTQEYEKSYFNYSLYIGIESRSIFDVPPEV